MFTPSQDVDLLILGAGWTSTFLIPLCAARGISYAATSRPAHPKPDTIPFEFDEDDAHPDPAPFARLPRAHTVLVTFPVRAKGAAERLVRLYEQTHTTHTHGDPDGHERDSEDTITRKAVWVQLGSTGIWDGGPTARNNQVGATQSAGQDKATGAVWLDRHSPFDKTNARAVAEDELLALSPGTPTTVLNLCGLWGGPRTVKNVIGRVAPTKEALKSKTSVHMIHGEDVARAILAVHDKFDRATGKRWLLTDSRVYDWWDLAAAWGDEHTKSSGYPREEDKAFIRSSGGAKGPQPKWVRELMNEESVRALPRTPEQLGRTLDSRDFWNTFELEPIMTRLE